LNVDFDNFGVKFIWYIQLLTTELFSFLNVIASEVEIGIKDRFQ